MYVTMVNLSLSKRKKIKHQKLIQKAKNRGIVRTTEKKIQEKFEKKNSQKRFERGVPFWHFPSHINQNRKNSRKTVSYKFQKSKKVKITEKKIQEEFENNQKRFEGGVTFWRFCSHTVLC